jgi:hypothetical protein
LHAEATKAATEVGEVVPSPDSADKALQAFDRAPDPVDKILQESARSPKAALLLLAAEIEKELRRVLLGSGWHAGQEIHGIRQGFDILTRLEVLPKHVAGSVRLFSEMRNKLVHGGNATDDDILRAIDSGVTILKTLRSISLEIHKVHHPGVELYSDSDGKRLLPNVRGLILETTSPGGTNKRHAVYPTTRVHFAKGQRVAWEWNLQNKYGRTWYRDPDSGEIKPAFHSAGEFIGRDLDGA